jgi:hypothetical protein
MTAFESTCYVVCTPYYALLCEDAFLQEIEAFRLHPKLIVLCTSCEESAIKIADMKSKAPWHALGASSDH